MKSTEPRWGRHEKITGDGPWTLKQIRDAYGLNQTDFAVLLSRFLPEGDKPWSLKTVSSYENADRGSPSQKYLQNVATACGISIDLIAVPARSGAYNLKPRPDLQTNDSVAKEMTPQEFRDLADRTAIECHRRGHRVAARALMDLVEALDHLSGAASTAGMSAGAKQAVTDLAAMRVEKPTP